MLKKHLDLLSIIEENKALLTGHFALPNGKHSQIYIDTDILLQFPSLAAKLGSGIANLFSKKADIVFASSQESLLLAAQVAVFMGARVMGAKFKDGKLELKETLKIKEGDKVLIIDNVFMTGRKINQTLQLLQRYHATIIGVAVLVDRSNGLNLAFENVPLRALLTYPLDLYEPDSCPMCKQQIPFTNKEK